MNPDSIGRYQIKEELGRGGMATVYLAHDPRAGRDVAVKVIHTGSQDDPHFRARFEKEIKTVANLEDVPVVPLYDTGVTENDQPYLVMRYMMGGSLADEMQSAPLAPPRVLEVVERIARVLDAAHAQGIIHRDLKPSNVLLDRSGKAFLADFGIAKRTQDTSSLTGSHHPGTLGYMSPEQLSGQKIDGRSDIYALGVLTYEMLAGRRPYEGSTGQIVMAVLQEEAPDIHQLNPTLPYECTPTLQKALAKDPADRYATAEEMVTMLQAAFTSPSAYQAAADNVTSPTSTWEEPADAAEQVWGNADTSPRTKPETTKETPHGRIPWKTVTPLALILFLIIAGLVWWFGLRDGNTPAVVEITAPPTATLRPSATPTTPTPRPPAPEPEADTIMVINRTDSAIWQSGDDIERIPDDGRVPIKPGETIRLQSNAEPRLEILLPNRVTLLLDMNTEVEVAAPYSDSGDFLLTLLRGRILLGTLDQPMTISNENTGSVTLENGRVGAAINEATSQLEVDCLDGPCFLTGADDAAQELATGQSSAITAEGAVTGPAAARYNLYDQLASVYPTPTPTATATATQTPTSTPTASATPLDLSESVDLLSIGRSVKDAPLEAIRIGNGPKAVLLVGGIHAGYAPNSVAVAEEAADYFRRVPSAVSPDISLYIIPNLNPDALVTPGELPGRLNANGVDLNRNWDCRWEENPQVLGQTVSGGGGTEPASEPESQALKTLIDQIDPAAIIFWGAGKRFVGQATPGACLEQSQVSASLSKIYGRAAGHTFVENVNVLASPSLTGDVTNWLDQNGRPAMFVILPGFLSYAWESELAGINAVMQAASDDQLQVTPTPATCAYEPAEPWRDLYDSVYKHPLGCAVAAAVSPTGAVQRFANGLMIWRQDKERVYVLTNDEKLTEHDVNNPDLRGYYDSDLHKGAFGYLYNNEPGLRDRLGAPLEAEAPADNFRLQDFAKGVILTYTNFGDNTTILLTDEARWKAY